MPQYAVLADGPRWPNAAVVKWDATREEYYIVHPGLTLESAHVLTDALNEEARNANG